MGVAVTTLSPCSLVLGATRIRQTNRFTDEEARGRKRQQPLGDEMGEHKRPLYIVVATTNELNVICKVVLVPFQIIIKIFLRNDDDKPQSIKCVLVFIVLKNKDIFVM